MLAVAGLAALLVVGALLIPVGEVVTLVTHDVYGLESDTQLWVVEVDGVLYLRASDPENEWLERARENPAVELGRAEYGKDARGRYMLRPFLATFPGDSGLRDRVWQAMVAKYGRPAAWWRLMGDPSEAVPIRLDPRPAAAPPSRSAP
jgi:hypothetical protein